MVATLVGAWHQADDLVGQADLLRVVVDHRVDLAVRDIHAVDPTGLADERNRQGNIPPPPEALLTMTLLPK